MALGKYARIDNNKKPSKFCSTVTILAFLGVCFLGVWLTTSSYVVPDEKLDVSLENDNGLKEQVRETHKDSNAEDNSSDAPEDATKGDTDVDTGSNSNLSDNQDDKPQEKIEQKIDEKPEENSSETDDGGRKQEAKDSTTGNGESNSETGESDKESDGNSSRSENNPFEKKSDSVESEKKPDSDENEKFNSGESEKKPDSIESERTPDSDDTEKKLQDPSETMDGDESNNQTEEKAEQNNNKEPKENSVEKEDGQSKSKNTSEVFTSGAESELLNETTTQTGSFSTQVTQSKNQKESLQFSTETSYSWKLCNVTAGPDYIPCLDNWQVIKSLKTNKHYEHRERHCPENPPTCLVSLPEGYSRSIQWPTSREKIWYSNVPHTKLAEVKGHQNWVKVSGEYLTFPGGGTQFKHGALHYIDFILETVPDIAWGNRSRVILDVGCGVASLGGFLFDRDVLTMSFAPKDEHEAQVQFALERGIPAISAVMGTERLPFPGRVFDIVHCARCRVPWHIEGGKLLLELNRVLRPGGYFVWSATPVYQKLPKDVEIWEAMKKLTETICWELVSISKDTVNGVGVAIYQKPSSNECYEKRPENEPPICAESDDPNAAWKVPLQACLHKVPLGTTERGSQWPAEWPSRADTTPYWLLSSQVGVYGKPAPEDFAADNEHWKRVVTKTYLNGMGIDWSNVRNVMDMRSVYGGFAAALKDLKIWVMNVVSVDAADTLPIIYERGLFGIYHDWCQSFSTYPRSYDLLHADHLFSKVKTKCNIVAVFVEVDRILRPEGKLIVRDDVETINELEKMAKSMQWEVRMTYSKEKKGLLCVQKSLWRPQQLETVAYAIA